tara:strand:- start:554 stop:811 length:258 start_codon:yes stop_codon:yes gene_type:complete
VSGYRDEDKELEESYKDCTAMERRAFYSPSQQYQFHFTASSNNISSIFNANWMNLSKDPIQKIFDKPFEEIQIAGLAMYNAPPRG